MSYQHILFDVSENIGVITLNRPDDANAIHKPMVEELLDIALRCYRDKAIRAAVLTGAGRLMRTAAASGSAGPASHINMCGSA